MTVFKRDIVNEISSFLSYNNHCVAVLHGLPCIGKSTILQQIAEARGSGYILADLATDREFRSVMSEALSAQVPSSTSREQSSLQKTSLLSVLSDFFGLPEETMRNTLLIFDGAEHLGPEIRKLFNSSLPDRCLIATDRADYLSSEEGTNTYFDNRVVQFFSVRSMTFSEFLSAIDHEDYRDIIRARVLDNKAIPRILRQELSELFNDYILIGGFPQAVSQYVSERTNIPALRAIHRQIYATIQSTLSDHRLPYSDSISPIRLQQIFDYLQESAEDYPLAFHPGRIRRGLSMSNFKAELRYLECNGLLAPVYISGAEMTKLDESEDNSENCIPVITDTGLQRLIGNDYDILFTEQDSLPSYVLQRALYAICFNNYIASRCVELSRDRIIPLMIESMNTAFVIVSNRTRKSRIAEEFLRNNNTLQCLHIADDSGRNEAPETADHNIMWFELDETLKCKKSHF